MKRDFETLVDIQPWRIEHLPSPAPDLVIACASVGHDATRAPSPEFVRTATAGGRPGLFVIDVARSWATAPGFGEALRVAVDAMRARQEIARILTIGSSMGGFAALRAAEELPVDAVLAISPQYRPAAPGETRWRPWTDALPTDLTAPLPEGPWIVLMHGIADDAAQAMAFPERKGVDHLLFAGIAHSGLAAHLKAKGGPGGMIEAALAGDRRRLLRIASGAGGRRRAQLPR